MQFWWLLDRALSLQVKQEKEVLSGEPSTKLAIGMRRLGRDLGTSPGKKSCRMLDFRPYLDATHVIQAEVLQRSLDASSDMSQASRRHLILSR